MRPTVGIPAPDAAGPAANKAVDLDGRFGMHPALALPEMGNWKELYDSGILAVVHAMHQEDPTRSHFDAMDFMERGTPGEKRLNTGWLGRHLSTLANGNGSPFRAVGMGNMLQASLRGPIPAAALRSIADFHLNGRQAEITRFQQHLQSLYGGDQWLDLQGQLTFDALELLEASLSGGTYTPENGANYPTSEFGRGMQQIAQMIKADVGLEVACIDVGGWDTHAQQVVPGNPATGNMANLMRGLAQGISAFVTDLKPYFDGTEAPAVTVATMSEFGRRAFENGAAGTDHGHGNVMFLAGAGINGGQVFEKWPGLGDEQLDRGDLAGTIEYRDVLGEILAKRLGNSRIDQVFPNHAFEFLGVAKDREFETPTPIPTQSATPVSTAPRPENRVYLPWANTGS
jgi:uncharacterized protein (DUF1501 family)